MFWSGTDFADIEQQAEAAVEFPEAWAQRRLGFSLSGITADYTAFTEAGLLALPEYIG